MNYANRLLSYRNTSIERSFKSNNVDEILIIFLCLIVLIGLAKIEPLMKPLFPSRSAISLIYAEDINDQSEIVIVNLENKLTDYKIAFFDLNSNQLLHQTTFSLQPEKTKKIQLSSLKIKKSMIVNLYFMRGNVSHKQELILRPAPK